MASLTTAINCMDPTIYGSKQAILLGMQGKFSGVDSDGNEIKPSGSGRNEGKFLLGDLKKCSSIQKWIEENEDNNNNEVKEKKNFSGKKAKEAFSKLGISVEEYDQKGGSRSGKRTANSITCKDIKEFLKGNKVVADNVIVDEDKMFTTKKMKTRIDELGPRSKGIAMEYLRNNKGTYKSKKWWGKKEIDAAIKEINKQ
jgi:hypothetical protein